MKTCPNCKELVGDNVEKCFNCGWSFVDPSENERAIEREKKRKEEEEARKKRQEEQRIREEELKKQEEERRKREEMAAAIRRQQRDEKLARKNNIYEYTVIRVRDNYDGTCDEHQINFEIGLKAKRGWRLHSIYSNEIGRTSSPSLTGGSTNATICETVIVMERLVEFAKEDHD